MNTKTVKSSKINKVFFILAIILLTIILCLTYVHFGSTNIGYDGDEVFSYLSSNAEQGYKKLAALKDHTWYPSSYFRNALSVPSSCQFHYEIPIRNQATDVHPPIYYMLLHTICSFFPESFSMWYGISLNILLTLLSLIVLFFLLFLTLYPSLLKKRFVWVKLNVIVRPAFRLCTKNQMDNQSQDSVYNPEEYCGYSHKA